MQQSVSALVRKPAAQLAPAPVVAPKAPAEGGGKAGVVEGIAEEIMLVIAAAVAAFLGKIGADPIRRGTCTARNEPVGTTGSCVRAGVPQPCSSRMTTLRHFCSRRKRLENQEPLVKLNVTVDGKTYEVEVEVQDDDHGRSLGGYIPPQPPSGSVAMPSMPVAAASNGHVRSGRRCERG